MKIFTVSLTLFVAILSVTAIILHTDDLPKEYVDKKYSNDESKFLTTETGVRIHYRDEGPSQGPVIVLIHGSNASLHAWEPWVKILKKNYRVITLDLPAHGLTGATPDKDYSPKAQIQTLESVISHLNIKSFVLGGHSMGGGITWRYALQHPKRIRAMLLINSSGFPQFKQDLIENEEKIERRKPETGTLLAFNLLSKKWFQNIALHINPYFLAVQGAKSAYNNSPVVTKELVNRYYELNLREGTRAATLSRFSSSNWQIEKSIDTTNLTMPALIVWGAEDSIIPPKVAGQFADALQKSTLVIYDNVGHVPMEEIPNQSAADVLSFFEEINF